jgi:hypothetical protein
MTANGLSVEGASAALLSELLAEYAALLATVNPAAPNALRPGLDRSTVEAVIRPIVDETNDEVIAWWGWSDGVEDGARIPARNVPMRLEHAISYYERRPKGVDDWTQWNPAWLPIIFEARVGMRVDRAVSPPPVRPLNSEFGDHTQDSPRPTQVASLCAPVTWWITALREGWESFDETTGKWRLATRSSYPPDWWDTRLV